MWRGACMAVLSVALNAQAAAAADRQRAPDVSVVPKVVRTVPIPNNNEPAWSTAWVDMPTARDSNAGGELVNHAAGEAKPIPLPLQTAAIKDAAPLAPAAHIDTVKVLAAVGGVLMSLAIGVVLYVNHARPVRPEAPRFDPPGPMDQVPFWMRQRNCASAHPDVPSVETFDREMRKIIGGSRANAEPAAPLKPVAFDPYA